MILSRDITIVTNKRSSFLLTRANYNRNDNVCKMEKTDAITTHSNALRRDLNLNSRGESRLIHLECLLLLLLIELPFHHLRSSNIYLLSLTERYVEQIPDK